MQVVAFEKACLLQTRDRQECRREADRSKAFADAITHTVSLLHAVCLQHLRGDWDLGNLCSHDPDGAPPPTVSSHPIRTQSCLCDIFMDILHWLAACVGLLIGTHCAMLDLYAVTSANLIGICLSEYMSLYHGSMLIFVTLPATDATNILHTSSCAKIQRQR